MEDLGDGVPPFARGLEILLVDHDMTSLSHLAGVLEQYSFKVTTTEMGSVALSMIEADRERSFSLVMVNVRMKDMNILKFIRILFKKNIPIILIATSADTEIALEGLKEGASFFYEIPACLDDLRHVWHHVYSRKGQLIKGGSDGGAAAKEKKAKPGRKPGNLNLEESAGDLNLEKNKEKAVEVIDLEVPDCGAGHQEVTDDTKGKRKVSEEEDLIMSGNEYQGKKTRAETYKGSGEQVVFNDPKGKSKQVVKGQVTPIEVSAGIGILVKESENKETEFGMELEENNVSMSELAEENAENDMEEDKVVSNAEEKKKRVVWTRELRSKFIKAVSLLEKDKIVPRKILHKMNVPNLTSRQVASHLQKYKKQVKEINNSITPTSPIRSESSGVNISGFQQVPEMNLGGDIAQSLQNPVDGPFGFNGRMKLGSLNFYAQNHNQLEFPYRGLDTMSVTDVLRNQVIRSIQELNATPGNVTLGNQRLMPIHGPRALRGHVSPKEPSLAEKYLINFTEKNKELLATNVPAALPSGTGNKQQQHQFPDPDGKKGYSNSSDSEDSDQNAERLKSNLA